MLMLYNFMLIFMFISGLYVFCSMHKHLLLTLLSIEFLVLVLFLSFFYFLMNYMYNMYFILVFLTLSVCEGALGLSILVSLIRCHGNDNINSLSPLSW
uniref:NADH-ubiquinone oxidoreductase chain 4L n=1 Tax=Macrosaldula sp. PJ-2017 TaxID=2021942 RepID=A0A343ISD5_9HEMI|nr:NADH dehydrogenase subunit 4L [Macrosaldula sp. PJ-2017]AST10160.1 NADH dehydrogenase subunit 4L [Macrosaldula sp. PJ-2017]